MTELDQRIVASLARNPNRTDRKIADCIRGATAADVKRLRGGTAPTAKAPSMDAKAPSDNGFCLRGVRVLSRRPAESAAKHIKRLPKGRGFDPKALAHEWGMSEETIRNHARNLNCLKYVEVSEDEWMPLIMNPDTAKAYAL